MNKPNIFKSNKFHLDAGDVVHILIKDLTGTGVTIGLNDGEGTQEDSENVGFTTTTAPTTTELYPIKYGLLYNWYAVTDIRKIANTGWHVPTQSELTILQTYLGGWDIAGGKLKEVGLTYWDSPNTGATNETGFNGRAGGTTDLLGAFGGKGQVGKYVSATEAPPDSCVLMQIAYDNDNTFIGQNYKYDGFSLRLVKDSTVLSDGQSGTYVGNDGKDYRTICIGTQEWLADNLAETKYRNGDTIPEETDGGVWVALATGALCAYDNDWGNV